MEHRGPDGHGLYAEGPIALGHRRLAIIDVQGGAQPIFNEDHTVAVVLNGEIYNYRELLDRLRGRHEVRTASDTEVLVHLYEDMGVDMLHVLRGMFAFVLWDARKQRLLAARDRVGKKPLVYRQSGDELWVASEARAFEASGAPLGSIDRQALAGYLELLYVPAPRTIWTGLRKLEPGHYLLAERGSFETTRYWRSPDPGSQARAPSDTVERTLATLQESVALRLRSDVPVGVLLSGGIDSSVITALAAEAAAKPLTTFSVGFGRADDELPAARATAQRLGTDHREILLTENVWEATERALAAFSEPFGDSSAVPCSEVFKEVGRHVKVVLTGDGGDELFAGYDRYRLVERMPFVPFGQGVRRALANSVHSPLLRRVRRAAAIIGSRGYARSRAMMEVFNREERRALLGGDEAASFAERRVQGNANAALAFDLDVYLPDDLLHKTDITSMSWSVEARCPLLDQMLVEQVVPLPVACKQSSVRGKLLLEAAVGSRLPSEVFRRPKRGFGSPVGPWLRGPLREMFGDLVLASGSRMRAWLEPRAVERVAQLALDGRGNDHQAWALLALAAWSSSRIRPSRLAERPDS